MSKELILEEGKYTYIQHESGGAEALRYGEHWRDLTGDKFIGAMADRIEELEREVERLKTTPPDKREDLRCVVSDLCGQVREARAERDALQADNARLLEALENCRLLAARHRKEEWAGHVLRLCESAGVAATVLRSPK